METKHTQGEWKIEKFSFIPMSISCNMKTICHLTDTIQNLPEKEANAKLISSAPILLENLIRCVDRLEENDMGNMSAVRRAKEVIKKATE